METGIDTILVAPARSGSTFACDLLNKARGVIALDEPFSREELDGLTKRDFMGLIKRRFQEERQRIVQTGKALSTQADNHLTEHYGVAPDGSGPRRRQVTLGTISVNPGRQDFHLIFKHTLPFTSVVRELEAEYPMVALVRNPLAILLSWNAIDAAYRDGQVQPYAARLTGKLAAQLSQVDDRFERQVLMLDWHFKQYLPLLRSGRVVRYEDIIKSGGKALNVVAQSAAGLSETLNSRNKKPGNADQVDKLAEKLSKVKGAIWDFYDRASIEALRPALV